VLENPILRLQQCNSAGSQKRGLVHEKKKNALNCNMWGGTWEEGNDGKKKKQIAKYVCHVEKNSYEQW